MILSLLSDLKKEINEIIKIKIESYLSDMNLVQIEDFELLKEKVEIISKENISLKEKLEKINEQ